MPRVLGTVAVRLTLWYAAAFAVSAALAMAIVYSAVVGVLRAETDEELRQDLQETVSLVERGGIDAFRHELEREVAGPDSSSVFLRLWSGDGRSVASAGFEAPDATTLQAVRGQRHTATPTLRTIHPKHFEHGVRLGYANAEPDLVVEFGQTLSGVEQLLEALRNGIFIALPTLLLLGGPIGWFMSRRALRGVEIVTRTAMEITDGAMNRRVPVGSRGDELDRLAQAFNRMLDRIESLIAGMREVTDHLAHDLRTPLARIRASAERAATRHASPEEWNTFAETTTEECDRVLQFLNNTLEIAEAEAGATKLRLETIDLTQLVEEACELFATLADDAGIALEMPDPKPCMVEVDRSRVQRIVANLIDNALKFTPTGGRVTLCLADEGRWMRLDVIDTGRGIAAGDLPRIFERFFRGDGSRTGRGSGLGLSLARAFARAHGGELAVVSTPGVGSVFSLRLKTRDGLRPLAD